MSKYSELKNFNLNTFRKMKEDGEKITCITAYDYTSAKILDNAGIEMILTGDSLGNVMNGYANSIPVTMDEMIYHAKAVKRAVKRAYLIIDMPFGSSQISEEETLRNAIRLVKETGFDSVKLEGGLNKAPTVKHLTEEGIAVMGHIGLMPQMVNAMGGFRVQGRDGHEKILEDAQSLEEAGAFSIVIEGCVADVAETVSKNIKIPTIGIGAGSGCDGQVLVYHDVFGMYDDFTPKFVKQYADVKTVITDACKQYIDEVKSSKFPSKEYSY